MIKRSSLAALLLLLVAACADNSSSTDPELYHRLANINATPSAGLQICSKLDFDGLKWIEKYGDHERNAIALALNVSGSFEGADDWRNLTNNFDGQGISMGLLNQCLGQGSLQPLLISMRDRSYEPMKSFFSCCF